MRITYSKSWKVSLWRFWWYLSTWFPWSGEKKKLRGWKKKRTAVTGGRRGLDGGNLPFTFARHLRRMDGVSSAMTMTKTMKIQRQIQRFPLVGTFLIFARHLCHYQTTCNLWNETQSIQRLFPCQLHYSLYSLFCHCYAWTHNFKTCISDFKLIDSSYDV